MAEFSEVMKQAKRMCDSCGDCYGCPFLNNDHQCKYTHLLDSDATFEDVTDFENIVMKWAAENPEPKYPTWFYWQNDVFRNNYLEICPKSFGVDCPYNNVPTGHECDICRNRPIPAHIAEKLGIRPIGESGE